MRPVFFFFFFSIAGEMRGVVMARREPKCPDDPLTAQTASRPAALLSYSHFARTGPQTSDPVEATTAIRTHRKESPSPRGPPADTTHFTALAFTLLCQSGFGTGRARMPSHRTAAWHWQVWSGQMRNLDLFLERRIA